MRISIIIPALNEAACIEQTLVSLTNQAQPFEIIVVDGGSTDETRHIAQLHSHVIESSRGRANQMNAGATHASGDILLFLHADTLLPPNALSLIRSAVTQGFESGNFRLSFDIASPLLNFYSFCTRFKLPLFSFGDRGLFVLKETFNQLGGFATIPIFEDLDLVSRLNKGRSFTFLTAYVTTAARRFKENGYLKQQLLNSYLWCRYLAGTPPEKLASLYRYNTNHAPEKANLTP